MGIGHVKRCLALAEALQSDTIFALRYTSPNIESLIRRAGHDYVEIKDDSFEEAPWLRAQGGGSGIILDISHAETLKRLKDMPAYVKELRTLFPSVWLIDGMGSDALCEFAAIEADVTIVPYVGARAGTHGLWLIGSEYCILGAEYSAVRERTINMNANKLLITAGGSDPGRLSLLALEALTLIPNPTLEITLVVGAEFLPSYEKDIRDYIEASELSVILLSAPESLLELMLWCDLCISSSGLTKYELAATGTPAVLISMDERYFAIDQAFGAMSTALTLFNVDEHTPVDLADSLLALLEDCDRRVDMSTRGRILIDGKGASRVATAIHNAHIG